MYDVRINIMNNCTTNQQKLGITDMFMKEGLLHLSTLHPKVQRHSTIFAMNKNAEKLIRRLSLEKVYSWQIVRYAVDSQELIRTVETLDKATCATFLSLSEAISSISVIRSVINEFTKTLMTNHVADWMPSTDANVNEIRERLMTNDVIVCHHGGRMTSVTLMQTMARGQQGITASNVFFYGDREMDLIDTFRVTLRRMADVASIKGSFGILLHVPLNCNLDSFTKFMPNALKVTPIHSVGNTDVGQLVHDKKSITRYKSRL